LQLRTAKRVKKKKKRKENPSQQKKAEVSLVACACHPRYSKKCKIVGSESRLTWAKIEALSPK
jgi:hypothetical protein